MKTIKRLNIQDKLGYIFMNMTSINDIDPKLLVINEFTMSENGSVMFDISCCKENNTPHIVFNDIECIFRKSGVFSYLIFCESDKSKNMLDKYVRVIDEIKGEMLFIIEDDFFVMGKYFMRFRFKTNDNLPYNQKINVRVCVISISNVFKKRNWYYPRVKLQYCFYESDYFDEN